MDSSAPPALTPSELQDVLESSMTGCVIYQAIRNRAGQIIDFQARYCNQAMADLTKQSRQDILSRTAGERFPHGHPFFQHFVDVIRTGESRRFEEQALFVNTWYDVSITRLGDGVAVSFLNITPAKVVSLQLQEAAIQLQSLLDGSLACITTLEAVRDDAGRIVDLVYTTANRAAEILEGLPAEEMIGRRILDLFPGVRISGLFDRYVHTIETGEVQRFEHFYDADGFTGWLDFSMVRYNSNGILLTYLDITQSKLTQFQLEANVRDLKRSNEELEQFAYVASHDLQEPLRKIQSFGDVLLNRHGADLGPQAAGLVSRMQDAAQRMKNLIHDLLTFSRVSSRHDPFRPVDLKVICREVISDLDPALQPFVRVGDIPVVSGDPTQLRQLFQNLLTNALKFIGPNVKPEVRISSRLRTGADLPEVILPERRPADQSRDFWEISIADNGIGFDEKYLDRIFTIFQRLHNRSQFPGTGIGLAVCKKVVDNHNGYISASSRPGAGATFQVYFPRLPDGYSTASSSF
ncbi:sensor histidine kinase [Larkinella soli]|uniref:sensor histidine kinase n=1 Tax=Larkinella soli TaxID=1770527 RepID=UPI000FFC438E|nr:ATP-binding protein [Larkinella soli]